MACSNRLTLQEIIQHIKTAALLGGLFTSVVETKINKKDQSDTNLPTMMITLNDIPYSKLMMVGIEEAYDIELLMVTANNENPITDLKTLNDTFLINFFAIEDIKVYLKNQAIELINFSLSNEEKVYDLYGGQSATLKMRILNTNNFEV